MVKALRISTGELIVRKSAASSHRPTALLLLETRPAIPQICATEGGNRLASTTGAGLPRCGVIERN